jgi:hypothetical protein
MGLLTNMSRQPRLAAMAYALRLLFYPLDARALITGLDRSQPVPDLSARNLAGLNRNKIMEK